MSALKLLPFLIVASCTPPAEDLYQPFFWEVSRTGMRDALYGSCSSNNLLFTTGGREQSGTILRWSGGRWIAEPAFADAPMRDCWLGPRLQFLAVGENGNIWRRSAEGFIDESVDPRYDLLAIQGFNDGSAIAVGSDETSAPIALHFSPEAPQWLEMPLPEGALGPLHDIWSASSTNVWAVGAGGTIAHYDGAEWSLEPGEMAADFYAISGVNPSDLFAAGDDGIWTRRGETWQLFASTPPLRGLWTASTHPLYGLALGPTALRYHRHSSGELEGSAETAELDSSLCGTSIAGASKAVFASAVDCETGEGAMLSHGGSFAGPIFSGK
jgi:hypothetical protein